MNNRIYIWLVLIVLTVAAAVFICTQKDKGNNVSVNPMPAPTSVIPNGWKTFESKDKGFKISYPADFTVSETDAVMITAPQGRKDITVVANCNEELPGDTLPYIIKQITFKNLPTTEYYRDGTNDTATTRIIRFSQGNKCFTITSYSHFTGDPGVEDLQPIVDTFEFVN